MKFFDPRERSVVLFLFLISLVLVSGWFRSGNLFLGAEENVPFYNLNYSLKIYSQTWLEQFLGVAYLTDIVKIPFFSILVFLNQLGISNFFLQVGTFFLFLFGGSLSCYYLLKSILVKHTKTILPSFFGAIFYLLNPYAISDVWSRGIYSQFFAYLYYPLFLWFFVLFLETKNWLYLFLGWLVSFVLSSAMGNPSYTISLWVLMGSYLVFYLFENRQKPREMFLAGLGFLSYLTGWIVFNSWWLLIFIKFAPEAYLSAGSGFSNALESLEAVSNQAGFFNTIRLFHAIRFGPDLYGTVYDNFWLVVISWLLPVVAVCSIYFYRIRPFKFLIGLFLVGLVVCLGTTPPLGFLFKFLFQHLSIVQVFRNPYEKFGLVYLLAYSGLFGLGMTAIWAQVKERSWRWKGGVGSGLLALTCGVLVWPLWTGDVIGWGTKAGVPDRYSKLDNWQKEYNFNQSAILFLPFLPSLGASYHWNGGDYHGDDPIFQMIDAPVISQTGINPYLNALKTQIGQMDVSGALALIRIGLIVNRPDLVSEDQNKADLKKIIEQKKGEGLISRGSIDGLLIYSLEEPKTIPEVGLLENVLFVKDYQELFANSNQVDLQKNGFLLEGQNQNNPAEVNGFLSQITYQKKIDNNRFFLQFKNSSQKLIYLSKTFNPQWKIIPGVSEKEASGNFFNNIKLLFNSKISEQDHYVVNGYANLWVIPETDSKDFVIVYMPQIFENILWKISLVSFGTILIIVLYKILTIVKSKQ